MDAGQFWEWRFDAYRGGPTFNELVWKICCPVSSFFEDQRPTLEFDVKQDL